GTRPLYPRRHGSRGGGDRRRPGAGAGRGLAERVRPPGHRGRHAGRGGWGAAVRGPGHGPFPTRLCRTGRRDAWPSRGPARLTNRKGNARENPLPRGHRFRQGTRPFGGAPTRVATSSTATARAPAVCPPVSTTWRVVE